MDAALKEAIRRSLQDIQSDDQKPESSAPVEESSIAETDVSATVEYGANDANAAVVAEVVSVQKVQVAEPMTETSFSSQAIGHGDAAESLGHTLDDLAQAIDAVVTEVERQHPIHSIDIELELQDESVASTLNTFVEAATDHEAAAGEKIVDGVDDRDASVVDEETSAASEDEWHVVKEDEAEQVASDEMIARAAQLIGSALFQSDLMGSAEREASGLTHSVGSDLMNSGEFEASEWSQTVGGTGSDSFSLPSTVPSLVPDNQISPAVLDRWALQLRQLHELGFHDDMVIVAILERISASLIGVDSDDEVSVTQVVNALLKN